MTCSRGPNGETKDRVTYLSCTSRVGGKDEGREGESKDKEGSGIMHGNFSGGMMRGESRRGRGETGRG